MSFDVDIDVADGKTRERFGVRAIMYDEDKQAIQPHPSGIYMEPTIPVDQETGWAAIPYKQAEANGWMKIDLLTNSAYQEFQSKQEVLDLLHQEPDWSLLEDRKFIKKLPHIHKYHDLISDLQPQSLEDLADALALIRPGKKHLVDEYMRDKHRVRKKLYKRPTNNKYYFKRSHAIAFAGQIVVRMNYLSNEPQLVVF